VNANVAVTLQVFDDAQLTAPPTGQTYVAHAINLQPEGVTFDPPAVISFPYSDADLAGGDASTLTIWVYLNGSWQSLGGTVNMANHTVSVSVPHFTLYALMHRTLTTPPASAPLPVATPVPPVGRGVTGVPNAGDGHAASARDGWVALLEIAVLAIGGGLFAAGLGRRRR
jgi:hypothetical protein